MELRVGRKYKLGRKIGSGSFGGTYAPCHPRRRTVLARCFARAFFFSQSNDDGRNTRSRAAQCTHSAVYTRHAPDARLFMLQASAQLIGCVMPSTRALRSCTHRVKHWNHLRVCLRACVQTFTSAPM